MRKILNNAVTTDDFGNLVHKCQYTGKLTSVSDSIFLGAVTPQVKGSYVCNQDALGFRKASVKVFNETEANCNTCNKLERLPHKKQHPALPHKGRCLLSPYFNVVTFHPDDWMGMTCWEGRV